MILRLSGADFSTNNIGKISILRVLREDTKQLLSHYSRSLTDNQKFAVQDFIDGLKTSGVWSAIGNLYLPILCGSVEESLFNVKTMTMDATASAEYYEITDKGLASKDITDTTNIATVQLNASQQNLHLAVYNTENYSDALSQNEILFGNSVGNSANNQTSQFLIETTLIASAKTDMNTNVYFPNKEVNTTKSLKMIVQHTYGNMFVENTEKKYEFGATPCSTDNTYSNFPVGVLGLKSVTGRASSVHYGLLSLGTAMDGEKAKAYSELCDTFISEFV